jgi:S-adenosylmethionine decarboxylase
MKSVGRHLILEIWECQELNSPAVLEQVLHEAVDACGAHLLDMRVHTFSPQGVTGVAVVSESHIMIHTWPELDYAAVDVFTCGNNTDPYAVIPVVKKHFNPKRVQCMELRRGILDD